MEYARAPANATTAATGVWPESLSAHRVKQSQNILGATLVLIGTEGISSLSMSAIADAAGVSRQTLYKYFSDVDAVLYALAAMAAATDADLAELVASEPDVTAALRVFVAAVVGAAAAGHPSVAAMSAALPPDARLDLEAHAHRGESLVIELVRRGQADRTFRADLDPELDGRIVYRAVAGTHDLAAEEGADLDELTDHLSGALMRMLERDTTRRTRSGDR